MFKRGQRFAPPIAALAAAFALGALGRYALTEFSATAPGTDAARPIDAGDAEKRAYSRMGGPFSLTDHTGSTRTDRDFRGAFMLIYFGYTFCPDICPTELLGMSQSLDRLGPLGDRVQPILISIDPERDTVEVLKAYVGNFHPRLIGLTGDAREVAAAAKAYGVLYAREKADGDDAATADREYLMSHTSFVYLVGPDGRVRTVFTRGTSPEAMSRRLRRYLDGGATGAAAGEAATAPAPAAP